LALNFRRHTALHMSAFDAVDGSTTEPPYFMGISWGVPETPQLAPLPGDRRQAVQRRARIAIRLNVHFAPKATELLRGLEMTRCANTGLMQRSKIARRYSITLSGRTHPQGEERS